MTPPTPSARHVVRRLRRTARKAVRRARRLRGRLAGAPPIPPAKGPVKAADPSFAGTVERFDSGTIEGWVAVPAGHPPIRIHLRANKKLTLTSTWAVPVPERNGPGQILRFRFFAKDLWPHLQRTDRLQVLAEENPLPIAGHGMSFRPKANGTSTLDKLAVKLAEGYLFSKYGRLQLDKNLDLDWQRAIFAAYDEVMAILRTAYGLDPFATGGAVLGAVRDKQFIGHDNDIDIAFVSDRTEPQAVAAELRAMGLDMIERGYRVRCMRSHLIVWAPDNLDHRVDLFPHYFGPDGIMQFPFGVAGTADISREQWHGTTQIPLGVGVLTVPAPPEQMLETLFGSDWRQPNPGFSWLRDRRIRAEEAWVPLDDCEFIFWESQHKHEPDRDPSPFATWLCERTDLPRAVVDLGCGTGRDAFAFAALGCAVTAVDRSRHGLRRAAEGAAARGLTDRIRVEDCDVREVDRLRTVLRSVIDSAGGPVLFYARFLFNNLEEAVQEGLVAVIAEVARPEDLLAVEFRATGDAKLAKVTPAHFRRFQDGPAFAAALRGSYGFVPVHAEEGHGLARYTSLLPPLGEEDPLVYRLLARRVEAAAN